MQIQYYDKLENQEKLHGMYVYVCGICTYPKNRSIIYHITPTKVYIESDGLSKHAASVSKDMNSYLILRKCNKSGTYSKVLFQHKSNYFYFTTEKECEDKFDELCKLEKKNFEIAMNESCKEFIEKIELFKKRFK